MTHRWQHCPPQFITFEGGEGTGKSTQLKKLTKYCLEHDVDHIVTREPGGCESAEQIRELILTGTTERWDAVGELMMFSAARRQHLREVILPALAAGKWVLCDRFADTTRVYQFLRGVPIEQINYVNQMIVEDNWPDLTLVLDVDPRLGLSRKFRQMDLGLKETRFEELGGKFHEQVRELFKDLVEAEPDRCKLLSADANLKVVFERIVQAIDQHVQKQALAA